MTNKGKPTLEEFAAARRSKGELADVKDRDLIIEAESRGLMVTRDKPTERRIKLMGGKRGKVRFGVVSDTHLGHKHQQLTYWRDFTEKARAWGAEFMLHGGDVVDGGKMHRDQVYELFQHGASAQGKYAAAAIPRLESSQSIYPTHIIGGNHDGSFYDDAGANVFDTIVPNRKDLKFLGAPAAWFDYGPLRIYLLHPDGGVSYARSYRLQKIIEQLAPDSKPHILLTGHWHVDCHLPGYRNVEGIMVPCFQSQTAFLRRKGLSPVIGGVLIEAVYSPAGLEEIMLKWIRYSTPMNEDYP